MEILKKDITAAPATCTCVMVEIPNMIKDSPVKSYTEKELCPVCKAIQVSNGQVANERISEQEKEMKIRQEMDRIVRTEAIANLKARGEL